MIKKKNIFIAAIFTVATLTSLHPSSFTNALSLDEQIKAVQSEIDQYRTESAKLQDKAAGIEKEIANLVSQKQVIQGQINLTQLQLDKVQQQIAENQKKLENSKALLGEIMADMYVDGEISSIEMLASSQNIGDFVDKSTYRSAVSDQLTSTIDTVKKLKEELAQQQKETERLLGEQELAKKALSDKEAEQQNLLAQTQGDEAAYQSLVSDREKKKGALQRQQQALIEAAMRKNGGAGPFMIGDASKGGYPWENGCWVDANAWSHGGPNGNGTDPLGYGCRQCVSYTAWKVGQRTGNYPRYWGNANMWPSSARAAGYSTGKTPQANSVGVISAGAYGHVVWVDSVNGDGTVTVSQYNYYNAGGSGWGHYSKMRVSAATYDTYIYF